MQKLKVRAKWRRTVKFCDLSLSAEWVTIGNSNLVYRLTTASTRQLMINYPERGCG